MLLKILLKHMQVTSYFEDFFKTNTVVQSDFKFDGQFKNYNFLKN